MIRLTDNQVQFWEGVSRQREATAQPDVLTACRMLLAALEEPVGPAALVEVKKQAREAIDKATKRTEPAAANLPDTDVPVHNHPATEGYRMDCLRCKWAAAAPQLVQVCRHIRAALNCNYAAETIEREYGRELDAALAATRLAE